EKSILKDLTPSKIDFSVNGGTKTEAAQIHNQSVKDLNNDHSLVFYSDGSLLNGNIGGGYYMLTSGNISEVRFIFSLGNTAEVFDVELEACLLACQRAKQLANDHQQISDCWVFLDSIAAIKRLQHLRLGSGQSVAIAIHTLAHDLQELGTQLHIHWVPGHQQVKGNEIADSLAKQGSQLVFNPMYGVVTLAYLRRRIRKQALDDWNQLWIHRKAGRAFKGTPSRLINKQL